MSEKPRVFLGGTCNNSGWRNELIPLLDIDYFNPIVKDWTPDCQDTEIKERKTADYVLYVITPEMTGVYSIAEAVDDSNKRPDKTVFCIIGKKPSAIPRPRQEGVRFDAEPAFTEGQYKSLKAVESMIKRNGAKVCYSLEHVADYVNRDDGVEL